MDSPLWKRCTLDGAGGQRHKFRTRLEAQRIKIRKRDRNFGIENLDTARDPQKFSQGIPVWAQVLHEYSTSGKLGCGQLLPLRLPRDLGLLSKEFVI